MRVQILHQSAEGEKTDFGVRELSHMPPIGEPFPIDDHTCYVCRAYFGPDQNDTYLLMLDGEPIPVTSEED